MIKIDNMSKQTAVDWLVSQVNSDCLNSTFIQPKLIELAKDMEKQQIKNAYNEGVFSETEWRNSEKYYKETYL